MALVLQAQVSPLPVPLESSIDQGPYVNVTKDGMVTAIGNKQTNMEEEEELCHEHALHTEKDEDKVSVAETSGNKSKERTHSKTELSQPSEHDRSRVTAPIKRRMDQLSRYSRKSIWLLVYIAIVTTWPLVGSALLLTLKRNSKMSYRQLCSVDRTSYRSRYCCNASFGTWEWRTEFKKR
ncbi:hypothetical protein CK203_050550 [Vitis vinifera]|uniref:Embryogenesis-associated protein EMB8 n=1 Tax=Vitis vinifera TaxID=29760 RepID=A0A438GFH6_VITVI|nr:hypothetical protein CK203_050550 [Vitis vinifera]